MRISEAAIKNPVGAWMLMAALILFGWISFGRMGVSQLPDVDSPVVSVNVTLPGAAPEVMEMDVLDPLEEGLLSVQGILTMSSTARTGSASITLEFDLKKDINVAVAEIQTAVAQAMRHLPDDVEPPVVRKSNPEDQPILWMALTSDRLSQEQLMAYVRDNVRDRFNTLEGVSEVFLGGYVEPTLQVQLSSKELEKRYLTADDVITAVQHEHVELPSGHIVATDQEFNVRTMGEAPNPEAFSQLPIIARAGAPNFRPAKLGDVATIRYGLGEIRRISRSNGHLAVGLGIKKQAGTNAVEVAHRVKAKMAEVQSQLPEGMKLSVRFDTTRFIEEAIGELDFTLLLSALLTAAVMWLFLGSWTATLNVILAIPTSIIGTFMALYALGFTLNAFTLLGLSLAIGIVVDDAIMVLENIVRHHEDGKNRLQASLDGSKEIGFAALAATAAIIAIFLPVAFMKGIVGRYFYQFGVTLSVAVALSLLEALTLTPMRCSRFLDSTTRTTRIGRAVDGAFDALAKGYARALPWVLDRPWKVIIGSILFFAATVSLATILRREFVPAQDTRMLMARITAPVGSSLAYTDSHMKEIEAYFTGRPELDGYYAAIGGFGGGDVNTGMIFLTLKKPGERPINPATGNHFTQQELLSVYRDGLKAFKGVKAFVQDPSLSAFSAKRGFPIELTVKGPDYEQLIAASRSLMKAMDGTGLVADVDSDFQEGMPEIQIRPDRAKARNRGVSTDVVARTINVLVGGSIAGQYAQAGHRHDIVTQLESTERAKPEDILSLYVRNNRGELVPLGEVASLQKKASLQAIGRQDRERAISVYANLSPKVSQAVALQKILALSKEVLPAGYRVVPSGSAKTFQESFDSLIFALVLGIVVSYMVLATQFNSFVHPVTVLMALPFSVSGAFVALWIGGQSLNLYSMIGLILLMGIVKKNSILLVDFTNQVRAEGSPLRKALEKACPQRLRPILMTSVATVAGAIPPALALGPGAETRIPMALGVIGGVVVSTTLTLFVVPCVYSVLSGLENRGRRV